jgi:uncharacterized repeat protein (TIGR01451 family)
VTVSNLAPGTYSFSVVDAVGCVQNGTVSIPPINVISLNVVPTNPTCTSSNGSIAVTATGGTSPYTYLWSNAATAAAVSGLAAGCYTVTVTDAVGCSKTSAPYLNAVSPVSVGFATTPTNCLYSQTGAVASNVLGGTLPYSYSWSNGSTATGINGLGEGYYSLNVTDAVGCTAQGTAYVSNDNSSTTCYCTVTGTVYYDLNNNCIKDAGEVGIPNIQMHLVGFGYAYTDANGVYTFLAPSGTYTLMENVNSYYPLSACQSNSIVINSTAAAGCIITNDFSNSMLTIHDLKINLWRNWISTPPVPGNSYSQLMVIENNGTVTESSVTSSYKTDGQLNGAAISPAIFTANATNANYYEAAAVPAISAGAIQTYAFNYATPTNIPINTQLQFNDTCANATPMSNWLNDYSPWDNVNAYTDIVVSSYDPNFKEVAPKGKGIPGWITRNDSVLSYAVHFQNLGTYFAQNVVVLDTLDNDLNWSTLKPSYHSHNCEVTISETGVAKWTFKNIQLPAKMYNEALSNGMFTYTIHTKPGLAYGTQFTNSASIYFDYNEPVRTNKTINTLDSSAINAIETIVLNKAFNSIHLTPNPASSQVTISFNNADQSNLTSLSILDATGRVVYEKAIPSATTAINQTINTSALQSGFYFVLLKDAKGKTYNQKLVLAK